MPFFVGALNALFSFQCYLVRLCDCWRKFIKEFWFGDESALIFCFLFTRIITNDSQIIRNKFMVIRDKFMAIRVISK